ncbi:MAG: hypothetical protein DGJ47_000861 [Rickettsiaceae bacterium]
MQIAIANDHAGFTLKEKIIEVLELQNIKVINLGCNNHDRVDYPDYVHLLTESIIEGQATKGILICGTGIGMSIAANRSSAIHAALCTNEFMAERCRSHNNANVLVLGSKLNDDDASLEILQKFLTTEFEGGRHTKRIDKIR